MISVIIPVYNEQDNVEELHARVLAELRGTGRPFEILFVDDGSIDATYEKLKKLSPVKVIRLRRNSGQTAAMDAGFQAAAGTIFITLDGDLQNDPADIPRLIAKLEEGYDVVSGWRVNRRDSFGRRLLSRLANGLTYRAVGLYLHDYACAMKAYRKEAFEGVHLYGEMHVFLPAYLHGRGARVAEIEVNHRERTQGTSKHNFMKAVKDIADLLTVRFLTRYASRPMLFFGGWSAAWGGLGLLCAFAWALLKVLGLRLAGQTYLPVLAVLFLLAGFLLLVMGFLAELIIRVYFETLGRPPYPVRDRLENS